jgi:hypothetical protein
MLRSANNQCAAVAAQCETDDGKAIRPADFPQMSVA